MKKKRKSSVHKKVVKHLKGDIKNFKKEAAEDRDLIQKVKKDAKKATVKMGKKRSDLKFDKVLHEFKEGKLHSGSKKGPKVTKPAQATAIAYSEARRAYKKKKKK